MEAQTQPQQPGQHPVGLAQPPQPYPQPWPPYPGYPPPQSRRWMPYATLAAIVLAGLLIAGAILLSGTRSGPATTPQTPPGAPGTSAAASGNATCGEWATTKAALQAIPQLPDGWDWDTPNIDVYIQSRTGAISKALDLFEPHIADQPPGFAAAAHQYVSERRKEIQMLRAHTYTEADGVPVTAEETKLDQLCGVK